jgi:hypothetical protein
MRQDTNGSGRTIGDRRKGDEPALLFIKFVTHALGKLPKLALGFCIVGVYHKALKMPKPPAQVFQALTLLQVARDLGTDLDGA